MKTNSKKWKVGKYKNGNECPWTIFKTFCFQVRESPTLLNIPTPTPASDRGGPVACLGGPVACLAGPVACRGGPIACLGGPQWLLDS